MLRFAYLIITACVRLAIFGLVAYLVGKGDLKQEDVAPYINEAVQWLSLAITGGFLLAWAAWEKWRHGLVPNSPYKPFNMPGVLVSPKEINAKVAPDSSPIPNPNINPK